MMELPICDICQDKEKPSLSKVPGDVWLCDECIESKAHYEEFSEDIKQAESLKSKVA